MKYGVTNAMWAPLSEDTSESALPVYDKVIELDGVNESNDSLSLSEASAYGDNRKKITVKEFTDGTISAKFVYLPISTLHSILGTATDGEDGQSYGGDDDPPFGGYGFVSNRMDSAKNKFYEAVFYPKVQGAADSGNYKTKENSITLEYDSIPFDLLQPECGKYKVEKRFSTLAEAVTYLKGLFAGTAIAPGLEKTSETSEAATTSETSED